VLNILCGSLDFVTGDSSDDEVKKVKVFKQKLVKNSGMFVFICY